MLSHSILRRASGPISITPIVRSSLSKLYTRRRNQFESTEFSFTRFLTPYLADYDGFALFLDCDMLCLADITQLLTIVDEQPGRAVYVCKHDYIPRSNKKFLDQPQTAYPRKNWSSLMLFDTGRCKMLTQHYVNTASGLDLHRFNWLDNYSIGNIPLEWNYLVDEDNQSSLNPKIIHYTNGGPWFEEYKYCEHADLWFAEFQHMIDGSRFAKQLLT